MLLFFLHLLLFAITTVHSLSCSQQTTIEKTLVDILESRAKDGDEVPGDTAADWVRLCFHDAGSWEPKSRTGGAHACLWTDCAGCERHLPANAGLEEIMVRLESAYVPWRKALSRADYWYLSCKVAIEWASRNEVYIPFSWGRSDCKDKAPSWPDRHPDAEDHENAIPKHFQKRLGFSLEESYALMGAHSIGRASRRNSGYDGRWVSASEQNYFSNSFYKVLLSHDWYHFEVSPLKGKEAEHEYKARDLKDSLMLFTDIGMGWSMDDNDWGCNISRSSRSCPQKSSISILRRFAGDNNYWLRVFANAWYKLDHFGGDSLRENSRSCSYSYKRIGYESGSGSGSGSGSEYNSGSGYDSGSSDYNSGSGDYNSGSGDYNSGSGDYDSGSDYDSGRDSYDSGRSYHYSGGSSHEYHSSGGSSRSSGGSSYGYHSSGGNSDYNNNKDDSCED